MLYKTNATKKQILIIYFFFQQYRNLEYICKEIKLKLKILGC